MADPLWINASSGAPAYSANELRQAMALALMYDGRLLGARSGVRPGGIALRVSLASSTLTVQPGVACLDPGLSTPQGPYWVALPSAETHTLSLADATNPRKDIVVVRVYDHDEDASGLRLARSEYLVGAPSPTPSEPAVPAGAMRLATVDVPFLGNGSAVVTDRRVYTAAAGGILSVADPTEQATVGWQGLATYRRSNKGLYVHDGTDHVKVQPVTYEAQASADLTVTGAETDIAGTAITFSTGAAGAIYVAEATFAIDVTTVAAAGTYVVGRLQVDGVTQTREAQQDASTLGRSTPGQRWRGTLAASGSHTLKLRSTRSAASGVEVVRLGHTVLHVTVYES